MLKIPLATWIANAAVGLTGLYGDVTRQAGLADCSRQTIYDHSHKVQAAVDRVIAGCKKHGKWPGMGGAYTEELLKLYVDKGMKFLLSGNDLPMLTGAARAHHAKVRAFQK